MSTLNPTDPRSETSVGCGGGTLRAPWGGRRPFHRPKLDRLGSTRSLRLRGSMRPRPAGELQSADGGWLASQKLVSHVLVKIVIIQCLEVDKDGVIGEAVGNAGLYA
jgi:hypothetical protein